MPPICTILNAMPSFRSLLNTVLLAGALGTNAHAASTDCPQHFVQGQPPVVTQPKLQKRTQELCFTAFAVLHSGVSRTPLYAAEHLTRDNLAAAKQLPRKDSFHAEDRLPERDRAELKDYARSGYDRGHLAPNANMPTREAQAESFSLANMVPQIHANNAGVWAGMEAAARELARQEGELYVVSGPAFLGTELQQVGNVLVPTHLWKVLYSPRQQRAGAYLISNDETQDYDSLSLAELEQKTGINPMPSLPAQVRNAGMNLPEPNASYNSKKTEAGAGATAPRPAAEPETSWLNSVLHALLKTLQQLLGK